MPEAELLSLQIAILSQKHYNKKLQSGSPERTTYLRIGFYPIKKT